ncbi:translational activator of GCN4 [Scheffersomyces spartinae]|uniref:eIF-2-alpha kinase activator GCN1 n=1 Tax=Scheffersomyces spartinae TaxID=45513 RepID=A0A9P7V9Z3_9ASCO|nr:translational activator of GCN4 [Scheffersomyces spartinae]KAG7193940.1 translational activator of GCN4 [Scheffersomyces spartinae]
MFFTWDQISSLYQRDLFDPHLTTVLPLLETIRDINSVIPEDELPKVFGCLLRTFDHYQDPSTRKHLENTVIVLMASHKQLAPLLAKYTFHQVKNQVIIAYSDLLTLLSWSNSSLSILKDSTECLANTLVNQVYILSLLLESLSESLSGSLSSSSRRHARLIETAVLQTVTAWANTINENTQQALFVVSPVVKEKVNVLLVQLGLVLAVLQSDQVSINKPHIQSAFVSGEYPKQYLSAYVDEVVLRKHTLPPPCLACLSFFSSKFVTTSYVTEDDIANLILPNFDKAILRSSELLLGLIIPPFFVDSKLETLDLTQSLSTTTIGKKFFGSCLTGIKSTKESVRIGSQRILLAIITKNMAGDASFFIEEITKQIKLTSNLDFKLGFVSLLNQFPIHEVSLPKLVNLTQPLVTKEVHDSALSPLADSFITHLWASDEPTIIKQLSTTVNNGLKDKKLSLRRAWFTSLGDSQYNKQQHFQLIKEYLLPTMKQTWLEAVKSPVPTLTNKGIALAFVYVYMVNEATEEQAQFESLNEVIEFILNPKVYTKLSTDYEFEWYIKALFSLANTGLFASDLRGNNEFSSSVLFLQLSPTVPFNFQREALTKFTDLVNSDSQYVPNIISGIYNLLMEEKSSSTPTDWIYKNMSSLFSTLVQVPAHHEAEQNLAALLLATNHPSIPIKNKWVGLAQRRQQDEIDVGRVVGDNIQTILTDLQKYSDSNNELIHRAVVDSYAVIAFIRTEIVIPHVVKLLNCDLDLSTVHGLLDGEGNEDSLRIYQGEDDVLVVDPTTNNSKKASQIDKNSKDYETKKWEADLAKELAKKGKANANNKKYTKEEQALITQQLKKETELRTSVKSEIRKFIRSIDIINKLAQDATQVDNGAITWFPVAINKLLELCKYQNSTLLLADLPWKSYIELSKLLSDRVGPLKPFIGVATLRMLGTQLSDNYLQEQLLDLLSRILYRVKILSDQSPLPSLSLLYLLPLLSQVLEKGKAVAIKNSTTKKATTSEFVDEDPEEEQLLLAVEIISLHAELFEDDSIPRSQILEVLISLMKLPTKAKLSKDCFLAMCQHIAVSLNASDLRILLNNIVIPEVFVRNTILEAIDLEFDLTDIEGGLTYSNELWIAVQDNDAATRALAITIWEDNNLMVVEDAPMQLLQYAHVKDSGLRLSIAKAIYSAVNTLTDEGILTKTFDSMIDLYHIKKNPPPPKLDRFGLVIRSPSDNKDTWEERSTIALAFKLLSPLISDQQTISKIFNFLVDEKALSDKEDLVHQELQEAGVEIIKEHGSKYMETLIPIFEDCLSAKDDGSKTQDRIRESVIILYGALARHLSSDDDQRLISIVERLIKTLDTPSEDVQYAIAECLAPLVPSFEYKLQGYFDQLFETLFTSPKMPRRRGAAYGIAGLVKGSGIKALTQYDIIRTLTDAADDKKSPIKREGVSFTVEALSLCLGKYFEPYVIEILPNILKSLGDSTAEVREATDLAAKQIMKSTTSFGVKKLIPVAISNLDEIAWRSKKGSVELLGSMAYLDPAQLSASLSTIVPEIVGVLNDTHKEVRKAADQSLKRFGEVIRNPEIQEIVPDLIQAIGDPTKYTDLALDKLITTKFVHYIDGPSLALIIHVIHRGMKDRSAATKKKSCQIVGNMAFLVDGKDLKPYLTVLVNELEGAMVDPVPATRATAARALGSLVEKLGEEQFPDLIPRLLATLQDPEKAGDRLGSAQALSEVICGLGINKLEELMPIILQSASSGRNYIRAGFMPLLLFLPVCFGPQFAPYLSKIIPPILAGLADTDEEIRDVALRAGRLIVKNYAKKAVDLLLPELEKGLADSNYRIRLSSVELTGDLLFQITGISGKNELLEEQYEFSGEVNKTLVEVLGQDRRDRVLALLFVCRSDVTSIVRNASVDIWKALVANTPKTVKEILPTLTTIIVRKLALEDESQRTIAAQTLGEMVKRVGGNALTQLLPTLEHSIVNSNDDATKQGICIALTELIKSSNTDTIVEFQDVFIKIIRVALTEHARGVREAAAGAFEALQDELGKVVIDEIIPSLLVMLEGEGGESSNALSALEEIMATKSEVIFPILIPTLLTSPIDSFKAQALSSLASVAGSALFKRLSLIINTLVDAVIDSEASNTDSEVLKQSFDKILASIDGDEGVHPLMQQLLSLAKHEDKERRAVIYGRLGPFFASTNLDYSVYLQDMVGQFILSLGDPSPEVVSGTLNVLNALIKKQPKESLDKLIKPARQALSITGVSGEDLAGFSLPKGPNCVLPIFLHGLMYGTAELKEMSALGIADVITKTPALNLKPFATTMTGPLIRVIGEKVNSDIKAGILVALNSLLLKIPQFLRPFIPQLQRTFVRCLLDPTNSVLRNRAVVALSSLIEFQPRVDSLVLELATGAKNTTDQGVKSAMLKGMLEVLSKSGHNMSEASKTSIMTLVEEELNNTVVEDKFVVPYARLIGSLAQVLSTEEASNLLLQKILNKPVDKFGILCLNSFLKYAPYHIFQSQLEEQIIVKYIIECSNSSKDYISDNATLAIGKLLLLVGETHSPTSKSVDGTVPFTIEDELLTKQLMYQLAKNAVDPTSSSPDTRRLSLVVIRTISRVKRDQLTTKYLDILVPNVFACLRDAIIPIKLAAEKAYLALFNMIEDETSLSLFNQWFDDKATFDTVTGQLIVPRSINDYTKRVAVRLANVERERIEAGGDKETMFSDQYEDETEIWAVGGVELNNN